jgi:hypothetical protein
MASLYKLFLYQAANPTGRGELKLLIGVSDFYTSLALIQDINLRNCRPIVSTG